MKLTNRIAKLESKIDPEPLVITILTFYEDRNGKIVGRPRKVVTVCGG